MARKKKARKITTRGTRKIAKKASPKKAAASRRTTTKGEDDMIVIPNAMRLALAVNLDGLTPDDVVVELLIGRHTDSDKLRESRCYRFEWEGVMTEQGEHRYALQLTPEMCGKLEYRVRIYPWHEMLTHPFEMGMMRWL